MKRRLSFVRLLVDLGSVLDQCRQHIHLSFARGIVNRVVSIRVALIEQHSIVVPFEQDLADRLHRQALDDGEVQQIPIVLVAIDHRGILRHQTTHGLHRRFQCSHEQRCSLRQITSIDVCTLSENGLV